MLPRELFNTTIGVIQEVETQRIAFNDALSAVCDGYPIFDVDISGLGNCQTVLLMMLKESMHDRDDFVSWWLFEDVDKEIHWLYNDGKIERIVRLDTVDQLYDYLVDAYVPHGEKSYTITKDSFCSILNQARNHISTMMDISKAITRMCSCSHSGDVHFGYDYIKEQISAISALIAFAMDSASKDLPAEIEGLIYNTSISPEEIFDKLTLLQNTVSGEKVE